MEELAAYRADLLSALERVVDELAVAVSRLSQIDWHQPIQLGSPTPHYLLFHLRELEAHQFSAQLPRFLDGPHTALPAFDDKAWMAGHYLPAEPASDILDDLLKLRSQELIWLRNLPPDGWSRYARHPWWGEHTLQWWVELQLEYSIRHLRQLRSMKDV